MVLNEYFVRFLAMLKAGQRIDAKEKMELINISAIPHLKKTDSRKIIDFYSGILEDEEEIGAERIKRDRELLLKKLKGKVL